MNFPAGLTIRGAVMEDAPAVIELVHAAEKVDLGEALLDLSDIESDWASAKREVADDVILIHDGEALVAWGQVFEERADVDVHPDARGRGIGAALVRWTEQQARDKASPGAAARIGQTLPEGLEGFDELFRVRGYERLWDSWVLRLPAEVELTPRSLPAGVVIRPFRPAEAREVHSVIDDAFSEWDGRDPRPFEDWQSRTTARPDFDPGLLLVATADDVLVGVALGIHYPGEGWVEQVAVRPEFRNRGIATALLFELFSEFRERGESLLGLNTDSRTGALGLYTGLGMVVQHTFVRWSRLLSPEQPGC